MMRRQSPGQLRSITAAVVRSAAILFCSFVLALTHVSCGESPATPYESDDGVLLTCPEGWSITEDRVNELGGRYLQLEEGSFDSSGLVILNWTGEVVDRDAFLKGALASFKDSIGISDLEVGEAAEARFGALPALRVNYSFVIMGIDHRGALFVLNASGKTFLIIKQEALEDQVQNLAGFEVIEASFRCSK